MFLVSGRIQVLVIGRVLRDLDFLQVPSNISQTTASLLQTPTWPTIRRLRLCFRFANLDSSISIFFPGSLIFVIFTMTLLFKTSRQMESVKTFGQVCKNLNPNIYDTFSKPLTIYDTPKMYPPFLNNQLFQNNPKTRLY